LKITLPPAPSWDPRHDALASAVVSECAERGYEAVTIEDVVRRAGVTRAEFDRRFADLDDCAMRTYEALTALFRRRIGAAFNRHDDWREALRAAAYETADWMTENPELTPFGMTEVLKMRSETARICREETFVYCAEMIDAGRPFAPDPEAVPETASMIAIGSILQLLTHRLQVGEPVRPHAIVPEMMFGVVRVYLGEEAAREELAMRPRGPEGRSGLVSA
jgi:AcrR family transcriptional regulator